MYCKNCGKAVSDGIRFCPNCGYEVNHDTNNAQKPSVPKNTPTGNNNSTRQMHNEQQMRSRQQKSPAPMPQNPNNMSGNNNMPAQPTAALIVEGIGFLFFVYLMIINGSNNYSTQIWAKENSGGVFFIGLIFIVISFFIFKSHKKKHGLRGIGYAGYIISCIAAVLMLVMLIMSIVSVVITMLLIQRHAG